ncbi:MAG: PKD domain-containing protein, partial [Caldilineae bacterium]
VNDNGSALNAASSHNLIEDSANACGLTDGTNGNIIGQDPNLGTLTDFGFPGGWVVPLTLGSPAVDAGTNTGCPATDQRGAARPYGTTCDIGAYEAEFSPNTAPAADAGAPQTVKPGATVTLDGSGSSDPDGDPLTYRWQQTGGPAVTLSNPTAVTATFTAPNTAGVLTFTLTVTDTGGLSDSAVTTVTVANSTYTIFLPFVSRELTPFPIHVGPAVLTRTVTVQGETFYSTTLSIPSQLPTGGKFYFSGSATTPTEIVVDDGLFVLLNGQESFTYDFSTSGRPAPAMVEVPRSVIATWAGKQVVVEYRDLYGAIVQADEIWLIWVP